MDSIRVTGRSAQGVSVINVAQGDSVAALATIDMGSTGPGGDNGGGKGSPPAEQAALDGLEPPAASQRGKKPVPIKGRRPPKGKSSPARSSSRPAAPSPRSRPRRRQRRCQETRREEAGGDKEAEARGEEDDRGQEAHGA